MSKSKENLKAAFAGESQASRKYLYFAEKADKDGQPQIARLFRAASEAETVHARNHLRAVGGIGSVEENLNAAISGEHEEFTDMYPGFIKAAQDEKNSQAEMTFNWANKVEKIHHGLYQQALASLKSGKKAELKPYFVCQLCGYTIEGEAPDKCPVCGAMKTQFKKVE
ncbi:MAG TPA: rubrerythrin family protein [Dehalococcoidales bacterium]|nr:rubrerythrin family protein [Dehalococcoidales bacterium]